MKLYRAEFDFRHHQKDPHEGQHQYEMEGLAEVDDVSMVLRLSGDEEYRISGSINPSGSFEGVNANNPRTMATWSRISSDFFVGQWIENDRELLFSIRLSEVRKRRFTEEEDPYFDHSR